MKNAWGFLIIVLAIVLVIIMAVSSGGLSATSGTTAAPVYPSQNTSVPLNTRTISRDDAINDHWDEIASYLNGTETVQACSGESTNCYDLNADISGGAIDTIYFDNGGDLHFSADIANNGTASDVDENGNNWNFTLDMSSSIVDNAISQWADANGYTIQ